MPEHDRRDWKSLAAQVTKEQDPDKLSSLVNQLLDALDGRHNPKKRLTLASDRTLNILLVE